MDPDDALIASLHTSGRAVLFAGCTVVISLLGMFLLGLPWVYGLALGCIAAVILVMAAALTLLPALLGFSGSAIDKWHVPHLLRRGEGRKGHHTAGLAVEPGGSASSDRPRRSRPGHPGGAGLAAVLAAHGLHRCRERSDQPDDPAGLRPARPGVRAGEQRAPRRRRRPSGRLRPGRGRRLAAEAAADPRRRLRRAAPVQPGRRRRRADRRARRRRPRTGAPSRWCITSATRSCRRR